MAQVRDQSAAFRRVSADLDRMLERSEVSAEALRFQISLRDEALKLADLAGAAQESASIALGVVAQTGIVPLAGALKVGVDAAWGVGCGDRRLARHVVELLKLAPPLADPPLASGRGSLQHHPLDPDAPRRALPRRRGTRVARQ